MEIFRRMARNCVLRLISMPKTMKTSLAHGNLQILLFTKAHNTVGSVVLGTFPLRCHVLHHLSMRQHKKNAWRSLKIGDMRYIFQKCNNYSYLRIWNEPICISRHTATRESTKRKTNHSYPSVENSADQTFALLYEYHFLLVAFRMIKCVGRFSARMMVNAPFDAFVISVY